MAIAQQTMRQADLRALGRALEKLTEAGHNVVHDNMSAFVCLLLTSRTGHNLVSITIDDFLTRISRTTLTLSLRKTPFQLTHKDLEWVINFCLVARTPERSSVQHGVWDRLTNSCA